MDGWRVVPLSRAAGPAHFCPKREGGGDLEVLWQNQIGHGGAKWGGGSRVPLWIPICGTNLEEEEEATNIMMHLCQASDTKEREGQAAAAFALH